MSIDWSKMPAPRAAKRPLFSRATRESIGECLAIGLAIAALLAWWMVLP